MGEAERKRPTERVAEIVDHYVAVTIPVHVRVDAKGAVLSEPEAEEILRGANSIALGPCGCRTEARNCDAPIDTCLVFDEEIEALAKSGYDGFRPVSHVEAVAALRASHAGGLVHMAYRRGEERITQLCSCCSCCCWFMGKLKAFDYHEAIVEANYVARQDEQLCTGCGVCVDRCPFDAWTQGVTRPQVTAEHCFGCGVCVSACPSGAIALAPRASS